MATLDSLSVTLNDVNSRVRSTRAVAITVLVLVLLYALLDYMAFTYIRMKLSGKLVTFKEWIAGLSWTKSDDPDSDPPSP